MNVFYNFSLFFSYILLLLTIHFSTCQNRIMIFNNFRQSVYFFYQFLSLPVVFILQHCILHIVCSIMFIYYFLFHFPFPLQYFFLHMIWFIILIHCFLFHFRIHPLFFFYFSGKYVYTISQNSSGRIPGKRLWILLCSFL